MSLQDLQHSIARHIRDAIPGHEVEDYHRAARAVSSLWRGDEYKSGYRHGKEVGLAESAHGGEVATLRERLKRCEGTKPAPTTDEPAPTDALDFGDWDGAA